MHWMKRTSLYEALYVHSASFVHMEAKSYLIHLEMESAIVIRLHETFPSTPPTNSHVRKSAKTCTGLHHCAEKSAQQRTEKIRREAPNIQNKSNPLPSLMLRVLKIDMEPKLPSPPAPGSQSFLGEGGSFSPAFALLRSPEQHPYSSASFGVFWTDKAGHRGKTGSLIPLSPTVFVLPNYCDKATHWALFYYKHFGANVGGITATSQWKMGQTQHYTIFAITKMRNKIRDELWLHRCVFFPQSSA